MSCESGEVYEETFQSWNERLPVIFASYSPQDILNMNETGKFCRALPNPFLKQQSSAVVANNPGSGLHVRSL